MSESNNTVLNALLSALEATPGDIDLLSHVADLLEKSDRFDESLQHYQRALVQNPVHPASILGAFRCSQKLGHDSLAAGYQQLIDSLGIDRENSDISNDINNDINVDEQNPIKDDAEDDSQNDLQDEKRMPTTDQNSSEIFSIVPNSNPRKRDTVLRLVKNDDNGEPWLDVEESTICLDDVGGMDEIKKRLQLSFLGPLKNPELMKAYGKSVSGGLLLYGPPGCGKTFIARALAGELGAKFISIGLTDILDMYVGESERKLHEIFEAARRSTPAVLFFDELDALGQKRSQLRNSGMRSLVNQLLAEMDSLNSENENLFILGATNHPWDIDSALRRPGRFDRLVAVLPPDNKARESILNYHLAAKPVGKVDIEGLAKVTDGFSGADLKYLCDTAAEYVIEEVLSSGDVRPIVNSDFKKPLAEIKPSTRLWFETAKNVAMFANESGTYDDLLEYIRAHHL